MKGERLGTVSTPITGATGTDDAGSAVGRIVELVTAGVKVGVAATPVGDSPGVVPPRIPPADEQAILLAVGESTHNIRFIRRLF